MTTTVAPGMGWPSILRTSFKSLSQKPRLTVVGWVQPTNAKPWYSVGCTHPTSAASDPFGTDSDHLPGLVLLLVCLGGLLLNLTMSERAMRAGEEQR